MPDYGETVDLHRLISDAVYDFTDYPDLVATTVLNALGLEEIGYTFTPDGVAVHHDAPRLDDGQPVYRLSHIGSRDGAT